MPTASPTPDLYARLSRKLGVRSVRSDRDLATLVEKGVPAQAIQQLIAGGLAAAEAYHLILPRRTLAHRVARHEPLSHDESDKAVRVARVTALAEQIFGDVDRAWRWMRKMKARFGGRAPLEMLASEAGARLVEEMLWQVDEGMAA